MTQPAPQTPLPDYITATIQNFKQGCKKKKIQII